MTEEDLVRMDESQDATASFDYNGSNWRYDQSREIGYFKDCGSDGEGYYSWDFQEVDGERYVTVEKWEGEPFEVRSSRKTNPDDIQLFRTS